MKKITPGMLIGIGCTLLGIFLIFGDFSLTAILIQQAHGATAHLIIWLGFLIGSIGCVLFGLGAQKIARATKSAKPSH